MIPLDASSIRLNILQKYLNIPINIHILQSVDSTNQYLKTIDHCAGISICCAEAQTQGRGRFGREWFSPPFENIYFSMRLTLNIKALQLSGLSLIASIAVLDMLMKLNIKKDTYIKWPNDILWHHHKLCGCLIEIVQTNPLELIIGIGINVNSNTKQQTENLIPRCSLFDITGQQYDRNFLIGILINLLLKNIHQFAKNGLVSFIPKWNRYDYLKDKQVSVVHSSSTITGVVTGIDHLGHLILLDKNGTTHNLSSGETTISYSKI